MRKRMYYIEIQSNELEYSIQIKTFAHDRKKRLENMNLDIGCILFFCIQRDFWRLILNDLIFFQNFLIPQCEALLKSHNEHLQLF